MGNKATMKRFIGGLMIGGLLLGGSGFALATTTDAAGAQTDFATPISGSMMPGVKGMNSKLLQSILESLVSAGTITQTQADQIIAKEKQLATEHQNIKENMKNMTKAEREANHDQNKPQRVDAFTQLVNEGIITQEQADSIQAAFHDKMAALKQEQLTTALSGLVEKNVINNEQLVAILSKLNEIQVDRQAQMEATKDMTPDQSQAYFKANKTGKINPLAELVTAGTITQAQADEIAKVIPFGGGKGMGMHQGHGDFGFGKCAAKNSDK